MSQINTGGPAFPRPASEDRSRGTMPDGDSVVDSQVGMTLRDYFAAKALQGYLANDDDAFRTAQSLQVDADYCYRIADAMVAARSAKPQTTEPK